MIELDLPEHPRRFASFSGLNLLPAGTFSPARFVALTADGAVQATGPNDHLVGISQEGTHDAPGLPGSTAYAATAGRPMAIYSLGDICRLEAGSGGFSPDDRLTSDLNGAGVPASVGDNFGAIAIEGADMGELARVQVVLGKVPAATFDVASLATANYPLTADDSGKTFLVGSPDLTATLPATASGLTFTFVITAAALSSGTGFSVSPAAADRIIGNGFTPVDDKDAINSGATERAGDLIQVTGDGVDGWYIAQVIGTWARQA